MTPLDLLREEVTNVGRALRETLRFDYGPEKSKEYYEECAARLDEIEKIVPLVRPDESHEIATHLYDLELLASWISLIERSHLGEFSWPFADDLRRIAKALLLEPDLKGDPVEPIIQIVAEGRGYRTIFEPQVPSVGAQRRFVVVVFPRSLKHHVLLHTIFGHEICHAALFSMGSPSILKTNVLKALIARGPLRSRAKATGWLMSPQTPTALKKSLKEYEAKFGSRYQLSEDHHQMWLDELICDLFGLLIFGPAFLAAHQSLLGPTHPNPYEIELSEPTHPPYAVRHKMLVQAMRILKWDKPVSGRRDRKVYLAESKLLDQLLEDPFPQWATVFSDDQLIRAADRMRQVFNRNGLTGYSPVGKATLVALVDRLSRSLPPILADIDTLGKPKLARIDISQTLYAGWVQWAGRKELSNGPALPFFTINRLCDHALLQQRAINETIDGKIV